VQTPNLPFGRYLFVTVKNQKRGVDHKSVLLSHAQHYEGNQHSPIIVMNTAKIDTDSHSCNLTAAVGHYPSYGLHHQASNPKTHRE
jgi:hypothetical protein